jgi:hypothetical protein
MWAKQHGHKDWMICGVADRSYCERIKDKRDQLLVFAHLCKSVIQRGEPWTTTMQQTYNTVTMEKTGN